MTANAKRKARRANSQHVQFMKNLHEGKWPETIPDEGYTCEQQETTSEKSCDVQRANGEIGSTREN